MLNEHARLRTFGRPVLPVVLGLTLGVLSWASVTQAQVMLDIIDNTGEPPAWMQAQEDQMDGWVPGAPPDNGRISVLVTLAPGIDRAPIRTFATNKGGHVRYEYKLLPNLINMRDIPLAAVDALRNMPGVVEVVEDEYHPNLVKLDDATPLVNARQDQIAAAGLSADGAGIRVCVCDTGIDTDHLMYADRIDFAASFDFHNNDPNPEDDHGHGSHVSGIAVGGTGLNVDFNCPGPEPFQGIAPEATLIGVKILNQFGGGFDSNIIAGIDHCGDQSPSGGRADVINLSIGTGNFSGTCDGHSWAAAANAAVANGVVVVAASGNECNSNSMGSPACGSSVIAVGATYKDDYPNCGNSTSSFNWCGTPQTNILVDDIVDFSNQSVNLDVVAPGSVIWSASNSPGGSSITTMSGTSMASPMVAGLAALVLSADPSLTPAQVRTLIQDGAIDLGDPGFDVAYGHGRIDAIATLLLISPCTVNADCDDGDACTTDICTSGTCSHDPVVCDDGVFCNGAETCDSGLGCQNGTPPSCDDGVGCTDDSCNAGTDSCDNIANDANCPDDGLFCNGTESCDAVSDCVSSGDPCPGGTVCNEATDTCDVSACDDDGTCESGEDCNNCPGDCFAGSGASCNNGVCEAGDGEDCVSCPADCNGKQNGNPNGRFCCGDGDGTGPLPCSDPICSTNGWVCTDTPATPSCCGDGTCEGTEDSSNCEVDCGPAEVCGNLSCGAGEDQCNCPGDCGAPPANETDCADGVDEDCDGFTDCDDGDCDLDPSCQCLSPGSSCTDDAECCSNKCKGPPGGKTCK
ncbi:MAG: S8 family serine peptidase [Planctomycetes bacterium]|nr:S8 family serine peptidase [Planctomycetota bacterium]